MAEKIVIGLTGNIATGKSIVLRMLQELGATAIDADKLVHQLMRQGTPVYTAIINEFGNYVLDETGQISRPKLAQIVFNDPHGMEKLEAITHPPVRKVILKLIDDAPTKVVVVEAIKLFESGLAEQCDSNWVVVAPPDLQLKRLVERRKMSLDAAKQRIKAQGSQQEKARKADVIIDNSGALAKTWTVVKGHYTKLVEAETETAISQPPQPIVTPVEATIGEITIRRAKREDLNDLAGLFSTATQGALNPDLSEMMEFLFSRAYIVAMSNGQVVGMLAWQTENLVAGLQDFYVLRDDLWPVVGQKMLEKVHEEINSLSCEVALAFVSNLAGSKPIEFLRGHEYELTSRDELIPDWKEAAVEWQPENSVLLFKKMREQRIMVPM
jgi:dephospho-CoA kinase